MPSLPAYLQSFSQPLSSTLRLVNDTSVISPPLMCAHTRFDWGEAHVRDSPAGVTDLAATSIPAGTVSVTSTVVLCGNSPSSTQLPAGTTTVEVAPVEVFLTVKV